MENIIKQVVEGLKFRGYGDDIVWLVPDDVEGGYHDKIEIDRDENTPESMIWIGGWISIEKKEDGSIEDVFYESGRRGAPTEFDRKSFEEESEAVAYALGKMLEVELRELLA